MNRMKNKISQAGFTLVELIFALALLVVGPACVFGWVNNIIKLAHTSFEPITGIAVLRVVGILVVPLGCVLGYM
jgi:prepilin-type N-terminal cleavage/methylation domain-containing protein